MKERSFMIDFSVSAFFISLSIFTITASSWLGAGL